MYLPYVDIIINNNERTGCSGISVCILFTEGENTQLHTNCIHRKILELASSVMLYIIYFVMRKNLQNTTILRQLFQKHQSY